MSRGVRCPAIQAGNPTRREGKANASADIRLSLSLLPLFHCSGRRPKPGARRDTGLGHGIHRGQPGRMALALGYLNDHWMRIRQEAKRQGVVLSYHRVCEMPLAAPGSTAGDPNSIVLLTEYKNITAFFWTRNRFRLDSPPSTKRHARSCSAQARRALQNRGETRVHGTTRGSRHGAV